MSKTSNLMENMARLLELGVLAKIVHIERDDKGKIKKAELSPALKSGVKFLGLGKGEEALYQRIKTGLVKKDGSPDGAAQAEINGWFASLEKWQKVQFQMTLGSLVDQSGQITAAVAFLRNLAALGKGEEGDKKRTEVCIQDRVFDETIPFWLKAGETIHDVLSDDWPSKAIQRVKDHIKSFGNLMKKGADKTKDIAKNIQSGFKKLATDLDVENKANAGLERRKARLEQLKEKRKR